MVLENMYYICTIYVLYKQNLNLISVCSNGEYELHKQNSTENKTMRLIIEDLEDGRCITTKNESAFQKKKKSRRQVLYLNDHLLVWACRVYSSIMALKISIHFSPKKYFRRSQLKSHNSTNKR